MAVWGTGIFCDDVARDVRSQYRALLESGHSAASATRQVLAAWEEALADPDDGPVVWLALAALQCQYGGLQKRVKSNAQKIIDNGLDLPRWEAMNDPPLVRGRKAALKRLREKLAAPQPAKTKPPKRRQPRKHYIENKSTWPLGEVFAYRLQSGLHILLHVCDYFGNRKAGYDPVFAVLDWQGKTLPTADEIQGLRLKRRGTVFLISVGRLWEEELPQDRIMRLNVHKERRRVTIDRTHYDCRWKHFDDHLQEYLGWK